MSSFAQVDQGCLARVCETKRRLKSTAMAIMFVCVCLSHLTCKWMMRTDLEIQPRETGCKRVAKNGSSSKDRGYSECAIPLPRRAAGGVASLGWSRLGASAE